MIVFAPFLLALLLGACNSVSVFKGAGYSDARLAGRIERAYEARDTCLAKNAVPSSGGEAGVASVAGAVSLAVVEASAATPRRSKSRAGIEADQDGIE